MRKQKKRKKSWMYVMVDEWVDFVFDAAAAAVVVFPSERLRDLYNQISHANLKTKKKELPEVDSTGVVIVP